MPIRVLPELLVNRIAAGEVIVRPASVVKELLENSIDAGATRIEIDLANACRDITVRDDGHGISREDAPLALQRHATSKITEFDDLYNLDTRGFRGEALASIASVARVQVLTRRKGDIAGTRILAEGPGEPRIETAGAPEGTEFRVRELFFNTPPRLKFLKSPSAELNQVLQMVTRQAFIRPTIGFKVTSEKGALLDLPSDQDWADRVATLLGSGVRDHLLDVNEERHGIHVTGFVTRPAVSRKDRRHQFFFINGRPVTSRSLSFVLQEAYRGIIMVQRYPVCVLNITLPPGEVDINVHPTKEEVRFRSENMVNGVVHRVVHGRLQQANLMPTVSFDEGTPVPLQPETNDAFPFASPPVQPFLSPGAQQSDLLPGTAESFHRPRESEIPVDFRLMTRTLPGTPLPAAASPSGDFPSGPAATLPQEPSGLAAFVPAPPPPEEAGSGCSVRPLQNSIHRMPDAPQDAVSYALLRDGIPPEPIGQVSRCYILASLGHDLLIIDQHAAHERLLYLQFSQRTQAVPCQPLLIPVSLDVPPAAIPYMDRLLPEFERFGLKIDHFGGQTYLVQTVPADLPHMNVAGVLGDLLDDFESLGKVEQVEVLRDRIITRMACRAAVKSGDILHLDEMRALLRDIANARLGFTCPHGRPTMVLMTRDQLDRQFKRKL